MPDSTASAYPFDFFSEHQIFGACTFQLNFHTSKVISAREQSASLLFSGCPVGAPCPIETTQMFFFGGMCELVIQLRWSGRANWGYPGATALHPHRWAPSGPGGTPAILWCAWNCQGGARPHWREHHKYRRTHVHVCMHTCTLACLYLAMVFIWPVPTAALIPPAMLVYRPLTTSECADMQHSMVLPTSQAPPVAQEVPFPGCQPVIGPNQPARHRRRPLSADYEADQRFPFDRRLS